ncbi:germ cell-specific gene 1-like protein isoform X2 [Phycodurus eques]|uniref:germ cell-specific gene 1-like protein isoform X2 n=1 Tax=Phycodurus eques TaxID=693459 RepID=UPI002ACE810A|nr:germ cell-specific gene 1-like protein isoform X2 [Phycodurus eques]
MGIDRRRRASLALTLNFLALFLAVSALGTSHWCAGTRKVVKPFCAGPVTTKRSFCIRFNSSNLNDTRLVQYIWETGEDKYVMRKFHTGIWFSCEQNINMTGVLWLCIVAECLYIMLLATGGILMSIEVCQFGNVIDGLKLNAFAAIFTVLSGLLGMVAHMMFTTAFQLSVSLGPEDWKPQTWDYSWSYMSLKVSTVDTRQPDNVRISCGEGGLLKSTIISTVLSVFSSSLRRPHRSSGRYADSSPSSMRPMTLVSSANLRSLTAGLAWSSFTACMASSVTTINRYTKTILEFKHKRRNIEKNLKIKQKLLELDAPEQVWDMYISSVPSTAEELLDLSSNGRKLSNASIFLDLNDLPDPQREEYC